MPKDESMFVITKNALINCEDISSIELIKKDSIADIEEGYVGKYMVSLISSMDHWIVIDEEDYLKIITFLV